MKRRHWISGLVGGMMLGLVSGASAQRQMEDLGRGLVAMRVSGSQVQVGWRMLGTDPDEIAFNLYRSSAGGAEVRVNGAPLRRTTDFRDSPPGLNVPNTYRVRPILGGVEQAPSGAFTVPANASVPTDHQNNPAPYLSIPLQIPPAGVTPDGGNYSYSANDCSIGDLDGDGEYEIIVKWDPSNSRDNAQAGLTGEVYLDAYKLNGVRLWRINLGRNIRAGAHYTQFMVYDLDGDGRAEVACKTADGTVDGTGAIIGDPNADYRDITPNPISGRIGYVLSGPEYLTVFNGLTGAALATARYIPERGNVSSWGDNYGNRVDRFLACVAYLDGIRPSLVMCRGYYTRTVLAAWDWRDGQFTPRWVFDSDRAGNGGYAGQGNHNLSVADVDGDGKDEIIYGACAIDDDGTGLYSTGFGHGDALHVSDMDPDRPGLEVWDVHENPTDAGAGEFRDARTGDLIFGLPGFGDTGRGLAVHMDARYRGYQMWSSASGGVYDRGGAEIAGGTPSINFAVWWDADLQRELLDNAGGGGADTKLDKWTGSEAGRILSPYSVGPGARSNNGTKSNPCLSGDILGDWREEILLRSVDSSQLMLFVSPHPATNRFRTFLHDPQYRLALAWQNVAYNQPPHPGFYVGAGMAEPPLPPVSNADLVWIGGGAGNAWDIATTRNWRTNGVWTADAPATFSQDQHVLFDLSGTPSPAVVLDGQLRPGAVTVHSPTDYAFDGPGSLAGAMNLRKAGTGTLTLNGAHSYTGPTVVSEGALLVNGSLDQSPVTVKQGVWLSSSIGGVGTLGGGAAVEAGGRVDPGNGPTAPGTLTIAYRLTLSGGVETRFDLSNDPVGPSNDVIHVTGDLALDGVNTLRIHPLDGSLAYGTYELIRVDGAIQGGLANLETPAIPGYTFFLIQDANAILLRVTKAKIAEPATFVGSDSIWRFRDDAQDLGTGWREPGYDDSAWKSGPPELGFGDGDETTLVANNGQWTTYFRHAFHVPAAQWVETLTARLKRDDGAVVYLNGVEVWRSNMPTGQTITYSTPASSTVANEAEQTWYTQSIPAGALADGWNLLAAEVHQVGLSSSDITFHLELDTTVFPADPPTLTMTPGGDITTLSWPNDGSPYSLYGTTDLTPPVQWSPIGVAPLLTNGHWFVHILYTNVPNAYFRLQIP